MCSTRCRCGRWPGSPGDETYQLRALRTERALLEHCWDEERGLFWDLAGAEQTPLRVSTWSSLAPLALPSLPEPIARG